MNGLGPSLLLVQRQSLRFAIAPELRQSLNVLQMSGAELEAHLREIERENPMLELEWPEEPHARRGRPGADGTERLPASPSGETLEQALLSQLGLADSPPEEKRAARFLAGNLDDRGYLAIDPEEAAECLGMSLPVVLRGLGLLQSLEPAGAAARSLEECLLLQAVRDPESPSLLPRLIRSHLQDAAKGRWSRIARVLGAEESEVSEAVRYLRKLVPRPGLPYADRSPVYVMPEAELGLAGGMPDIRFLRGRLPRIALSRLADATGGSPDWRTFAESKRREARRLIDDLAYRRSTLKAVIRAIAEEQAPFLAAGPAAIRPLTLETVAGRVGCHPSTVSRAVRDKFVRTAFGVYPLGRFFASRLETPDGGAVSSRAVKCRIRALIEGEDKRRPLTDGQLAEALRTEGVRVSRRTVAKYREEERLLSSALRGGSPLSVPERR